MDRGSGILLHITSLPSQYGIGDLGGAERLQAVAAATGSRAMAQDAAELRRLAESLRRRGSPPAEPATSHAVDAAVLSESVERLDLYEAEVVSASRFAQSPLDVSHSTTLVTAQDIRLSGLTQIADLLRRVVGTEVMQLTPGDTQVSIRGWNQRLANKVLVLIDGRSVYLDFLGATFWSLLPIAVEDIERIELIRGPASALYGASAFAGVVNIILRQPGRGESVLSAGGGSGRMGRGALALGGREGRLSYRVGGGYERADHHSIPVDAGRVDFDATGGSPVTGLARQWFSADMRYSMRPRTEVHFGTGICTGDVSFLGIGRLREMDARNALFSQSHASVSTPFGLSLRTFWNVFQGDVAQAYAAPGELRMDAAGITSHVADVELEWATDFVLGFEHALAVGAGYRLKSIAWQWLDGDHIEHHASAFLQDTVHLGSAAQLVASARLDRHPLLEKPQLSPRGSLVVRPTQLSALRVAVGTAFRSPTFLESYLNVANPTPVPGVTAYGVGNRQLLPERMLSAELGYRNEESEFVTLDMSVYYNWVDDQIRYAAMQAFGVGEQPGFDRQAGAFPVSELQFDNDATRWRQIGAELSLRAYPLRGVDVYVNYAVHDTASAEAGSDGRLRESDRRTSRHKVNVGAQLRSRFGIDAAVDLHYLSRQVWLEQVSTPETGVGFEELVLPEAWVLNARLGWRIPATAVSLGLVGTNVLGLFERGEGPVRSILGRHQEHPFGESLGGRLLATAALRF